jgi:hypothetical protein
MSYWLMLDEIEKVYIEECHVAGNQKLSKGPSKQF